MRILKMKPKNFPARKVKKQIEAKVRNRIIKEIELKDKYNLIDQARQVRTKKDRSGKSA